MLRNFYVGLLVIVATVASFKNANAQVQLTHFIVEQPVFSADFNDDFVVNSADLTVWYASFGVNANADADGDGDSDGADYLLWQQQMSSAAGHSGIARFGFVGHDKYLPLVNRTSAGQFQFYTNSSNMWLVDSSNMGSSHTVDQSNAPDLIVIKVMGPVVNGTRDFKYIYHKNGVITESAIVNRPHVFVNLTLNQQAQQIIMSNTQ